MTLAASSLERQCKNRVLESAIEGLQENRWFNGHASTKRRGQTAPKKNGQVGVTRQPVRMFSNAMDGEEKFASVCWQCLAGISVIVERQWYPDRSRSDGRQDPRVC